MKCPICRFSDTGVLESRVIDGGQKIRRRRVCHNCQHRFSTHEHVVRPRVTVVKRDQRREAFNSEKLRCGIERACHKRTVTSQQIDELIRRVEQKVWEQSAREVESAQLGRWVLAELKQLDSVAWIRFASVYLSFDDLEDFEALINQQI